MLPPLWRLGDPIENTSEPAAGKGLVLDAAGKIPAALLADKADLADAVMDGDAAGGVLAGTYPDPSFAADMATQAELDTHKSSSDHDGRYYTETETDTEIADAIAALPSIAILSASVNIPSTAAGGVGNLDVTISGLVVGDYCFLLGRSGIDARGFGVWTRSVVSVTDTITIDYVNAQTGTADPGATTMYFLRVRVP